MQKTPTVSRATLVRIGLKPRPVLLPSFLTRRGNYTDHQSNKLHKQEIEGIKRRYTHHPTRESICGCTTLDAGLML